VPANRVLDVHALRHSFSTLLSRGGVAPRTAQAAMRHSSIDLTMNVYTDPRQIDVQAALLQLPGLPLSDTLEIVPGVDEAETNGDQSTARKFAPGFAPTTDNRCPLASTDDQGRGELLAWLDAGLFDVKPDEGAKNEPLQAFSSGPIQRGRRDSNPQPPDRQSGTLTN